MSNWIGKFLKHGREVAHDAPKEAIKQAASEIDANAKALKNEVKKLGGTRRALDDLVDQMNHPGRKTNVRN